jgi:hypothetical protein
MDYAEAEVKIRDTINAHMELAKAYNRIMTDLENKRLLFYLEKQAAKPNAVDRRGIPLRIFYTIFVLWLCIFSSPSGKLKPEWLYVFEPYIKYILSAHIRRQYQKLHGLYLAELVTHKKDIPKEYLDELRQIATDIGDYSKTLPSLKGLTALLLAALSIIGTVFGIFGVRVPLYAVLTQIRSHC